MATGAADAAIVTDFFFYVSQQNCSGDLNQNLTKFLHNLADTCGLPSFDADFVTFRYHIKLVSLVDSPVWRGLLKLSLPLAETPKITVLEQFGNGSEALGIILYPPYQFATQVLFGGSLNLGRPDLGLAFAETIKPVCLPVACCTSFEEFMRVSSVHLRNVFAHSTEPYFVGRQSLYNASKKWCFSGKAPHPQHINCLFILV